MGPPSYFMIRARALHATGAALTSAETSCEWQPSVKDTLIDPDKSKFRAVHKIFCERRAPRAGLRGGRANNQTFDANTDPVVSKMIVLTPASILAKRVLIGLITALGLLYGSDYLYVRVRIVHPNPANPFHPLKSLPTPPIPKTNHKTNYKA